MIIVFLFLFEFIVVDVQVVIVDEFVFFGDWFECYQYLIDLGCKLLVFFEEWKIEQYCLFGCQLMVWIVLEGNVQLLCFYVISDLVIVFGLIYLVLWVYLGWLVEEILVIELIYIQDIGLLCYLLLMCSNGVVVMLVFICDIVQLQFVQL